MPRNGRRRFIALKRVDREGEWETRGASLLRRGGSSMRTMPEIGVFDDDIGEVCAIIEASRRL